ncbi:MAG: DUF58 domain-containing protein [Solobacterium sp.]|nr:DUF58 domain-containing protein [Solobacterium sp.]
MEYILLDDISTALELQISRRSMNINDGQFLSVYHGHGMEFDDLRDYAEGDSVRDIDWKASSRAGEILVRRNSAEKRYHTLFVIDSRRTMDADTPEGISKQELALKTFGTIGYMLNRQSADQGMLCSSDQVDFMPFGSGNVHLQRMMNHYADLAGRGEKSISELLKYYAEHIRRRCLLFVITDLNGCRELLKDFPSETAYRNEMFIIRTEDAFLSADNTIDVRSGMYSSDAYLLNTEIRKEEMRVRDEILSESNKLFAQHAVRSMSLSNADEILEKTAELFELRR